MENLSLLQQIAIMALPLIFAVTVHEAAHGWVADKLGDNTARSLGRITFNPIPHIDPIGTIILPIGLYASSALLGGTGFLFGYAKPVPVMFHRLHKPRRDMALVALAGPGANLIMAVLWALVFGITQHTLMGIPNVAEFLLYTAVFGVLINGFLMVLNLLPLLPLDGGRVLNAVLPASMARLHAKTEPWGIIILLAMLFMGWLMPLIWPLVNGLRTVLLGWFM